MSLFPTEEEQIAYIDTAESVSDTPSAFSMFIPQDDIDHILRTGGNADEARMKITAEFSKQKPIEDRAAFLKALYYGGNGLITENGRFSAWYRTFMPSLRGCSDRHTPFCHRYSQEIRTAM